MNKESFIKLIREITRQEVKNLLPAILTEAALSFKKKNLNENRQPVMASKNKNGGQQSDDSESFYRPANKSNNNGNPNKIVTKNPSLNKIFEETTGFMNSEDAYMNMDPYQMQLNEQHVMETSDDSDEILLDEIMSRRKPAGNSSQHRPAANAGGLPDFAQKDFSGMMKKMDKIVKQSRSA